jgi:hypothetical protein
MALFRGKPACSCLIEWLPVYEQMLLQEGIIKNSIDIYQLIGNAPASAGVHKYGGCYDIAQRVARAVWIARNMGAMGWPRDDDPNDGQPDFEPHQHGVLKGCPHNINARYQIPAGEAGYNGLGKNGRGGRDDGPRTGVQFPLRTYKEGIAWAKSQLEDDMPEPKDLWEWDGIPIEVPAASAEAIAGNPNWSPKSVLAVLLREQAKQTQQIAKLSAAVEALSKGTQPPKA